MYFNSITSVTIKRGVIGDAHHVNIFYKTDFSDKMTSLTSKKPVGSLVNLLKKLTVCIQIYIICMLANLQRISVFFDIFIRIKAIKKHIAIQLW